MALPSSASSATSLAAAGHSQDHIAKNANVPMAVSVTDALKSVKATRRSRPQSKKATSIAGITTSSTRSGLKSIASTIGGSNSSGSGSGSSTPNISTPQTTTRSVNPAADATSSTTSIARRSYKKMRLFPQNEAQGRNDDTINDAGSQNPTCSLSAAGSSSTRKTTKAARTVDLKRKGKKRSQEDFDDEQDIVQENANDDKNDSTDPSSSSPTREILRNSAHAVSSSAAPKLRKKATTTAVAKVPKSRKKRAATNSGPDITIPVGPISSTRRKRANSVTTDTTDAMAATTPTGAKWKKKERQSAKGEEKKTSYTPADLRPRGSRVRKLSAKAWATASDNTTDPPKAKKRRLARAAATAKAAAEAEAKAHSSASTEPASSPAHNLNSRFSDQGEPMDEIYNLDQEEKEEEGDLDDDEEYSRNNERNEDENNDDRHDDENDGLGGYGLGVSMTAGQNKVRNSRPQDYYHSQRERRCYRHLYQRNQHWYNHGQYQSGYNNHQGPAPQYSHIGPKELAASAALYTMQFDNWGRADGEELASIPLFASSNYPLLTSSPFYAPTVPYTHPSAENSYQTNHRPRRLAASGLGIARSAPMYGQPKRLFHPTTPHHHGYVTHQGDYSPAATVIVPELATRSNSANYSRDFFTRVAATPALVGLSATTPSCTSSAINENSDNDKWNLASTSDDWLQGPYLYTLYQSYNFKIEDIALLFIIGFVSSAIFGSVIANTADVWGRKRMALLFCCTSSTASLIRLSGNFQYLVVSHLLSGLSTALLYCVFEAWYISQHQRKGFAPALIGATFSTAIFLNGLVAILAGVVANISVQWSGHLAAPFVVSAVTLIFAFLMISSTWDENYGESKTNASGSVLKSMLEGLIVVKNDTNILSIGLAQTVFECCMYTFVLLYTPALEQSIQNSTSSTSATLPLGYLFSGMMVMTMLGSIAFKILSSKGLATDTLLSLALFISGASFCFITLSTTNSTYTVLSFLLFEFTTGMYFPSIGTLRAQAIPEQNRTGVMAFLRVPMNFAVCMILLRVHDLPVGNIFQICAILNFVGGLAILWRALDPQRQAQAQGPYVAAKNEDSHEL
ncbi:Molybdate-anion transporter [Gryganskiella cystojenkinii]|nr:Molybdate-anion transporter [Gryganskiella cystojenkinii]